MAFGEDSAAEAGADDEHVISIQHQRRLRLLWDRPDAPEGEEGNEGGEHAGKVISSFTATARLLLYTRLGAFAWRHTPPFRHMLQLSPSTATAPNTGKR